MTKDSEVAASMPNAHRSAAPEGTSVPAVLEIVDLSVMYGNGGSAVFAVRGVSLSVHSGRVTALIGESGSGKTTIVRAALDLLPSTARIVSGNVYLRTGGEDTDLTSLRGEAQRRKRWSDIAYVPQAAASSLNPLLTVREHFVETAAAHGMTERDAIDRAERSLAGVRLDSDRILAAYPHELSGGTRQRVMVAMSLLLEPAVIVLDEPTTGLDLITQRAILEILSELKTDRATGFLLVSHDLMVAEALADRLITLYAGRVVEDTALTSDWSPKHPYTQGLVAAIPDPLGRNSARPIGGQPPDARALPSGCPFHPRCPQAMEICRHGEPPTLRLAEASVVACHLFPPEADPER